MNKLICYAPAKINLHLDVLGRYPDGYHEIFTTFQAVDLYDTLTFEKQPSGGIHIVCDQPGFPLGPENLIHRALTLAGEFTAEPIHIRITVDKKIPMAAGLGGGSSDAAATILAANSLYELGLLSRELLDWARRLGADVPFFLGPPQAEGRGRGDELTPIDFFADYWLVLIQPPAGLTAAEVYREFDLRLTKNDRVVNFATCRDATGFFSLVARTENALRIPILRLCPEVGLISRFLGEQGIDVVRVTGSGPCVFGVVQDKPDAERFKWLMPSRGWRLFVCRPLRGPAAVGLGSRTG